MMETTARAAPQAARLLLVDPTLKDALGHNLDYARVVIRDAQAAGFICTAYVHRHSRLSAARLGCEVRPVFRSGHKDVPVSQLVTARARQMMGEAAYAGLRDVLRRADPSPSAGAALEPSQAFITDMRAVIADARPRSQDRIFLPNLHWHEAAWLAGELSAAAPATEVQMVLRFDPPADEAGQAVLQQAGAGAVSWFADTEELASAYARLLNRPVRRIPIPIDGEAIRSAARQRAASPATVLYLGESRREKGFHLLPEIIERTWAGQPAVRFIVQVSPNIAGGEKDIGKAVAALRKLQGPRVELRPSAVPSEDFPSLLASGQILLLPYQADAYRLRSSGLLVQGLASGLRIVAPAEPSWLRDYAARHARPGDVELCPSTAEGFARGVLAHASKPGVPPLPQRLEEEALPRPWSLPRQSVV